MYKEREARRNRGGSLKEREESTWSSSPNRSEERSFPRDRFLQNGRNLPTSPFYTNRPDSSNVCNVLVTCACAPPLLETAVLSKQTKLIEKVINWTKTSCTKTVQILIIVNN